MKEVSKKEFAVNAFWKILEQFSSKGISMLVSIVLARILLPSDYGILALTTVFTSLSDILIDGGFSTALIRKEKIDDLDYSAVFAVSSTISLFLYLVLYFVAPFLAQYYREEKLVLILRIIGITFFVQSFSAVQNGIVNRNMQFKLLFVCNTTASIISGIIGVFAAYQGLGVWSLVLQRIIQQFIYTAMILIKVRWKISWKFDFKRIKEMLSFSTGVVSASLLNYFGGNLYSIAIGKKYSVTDLGYYDKGNQLPMQFSLYTFGAMSNVLLPTISSCKGDIERVKQIIRKVVGMTSFLIMPLMVGLAVTSKEILVLLFTEKWLSSLPIMWFACLYYIATPYMLINIQVFFAFGKSKLRVKTELIRLGLMAFGLGLFGFVFNCTMNQLAFVSAVIAVLVAFVTYFEIRKLINYKIAELVADVWKAILSSGIMGTIIILLEFIIEFKNNIVSLVAKMLIGIIIYSGLVFILKMPEINDIICLLKRKNNNE